MNYFPLSNPVLAALAFLVAVVFVLIQLGVLQYTYERLGLSRGAALALLAASFLGSYVNIPVTYLETQAVEPAQVIEFFGMRYVVPPSVDVERTLLAVNLGGAVIPTLLSIYLLLRYQVFGRGVVATAVVSVIVYAMAEPVRGVGIAVPMFIPPVIAAGAAILLSRRLAPPLAYISGSLGTLIGADLLNLGEIPTLGAPVASIGGAGRFDGIFLTGILAVLLASFPALGRHEDRHGRRPPPDGG